MSLLQGHNIAQLFFFSENANLILINIVTLMEIIALCYIKQKKDTQHFYSVPTKTHSPTQNKIVCSNE